jgi:hypothetical protein
LRFRSPGGNVVDENNELLRPVNGTAIVSKDLPSTNNRGYYTCHVESQHCAMNGTVRVHVRVHIDAVWPLLGIILECLLISVFILVSEIRRRKKERRDAAVAATATADQRHR